MPSLKRDELNYVSDLNVHDVHTILGPESSFEGKLIFNGIVRIDGNFKGEIHTENTLVIGQGAHVEAQIYVGSVVVNGEVVGDIHAKQSVEIHAPGKLKGNIYTPDLMIAKGVIFEGTCQMEDTSLVQLPTLHASTPADNKIKLLKDPTDYEEDVSNLQ